MPTIYLPDDVCAEGVLNRTLVGWHICNDTWVVACCLECRDDGRATEFCNSIDGDLQGSIPGIKLHVLGSVAKHVGYDEELLSLLVSAVRSTRARNAAARCACTRNKLQSAVWTVVRYPARGPLLEGSGLLPRMHSAGATVATSPAASHATAPNVPCPPPFGAPHSAICRAVDAAGYVRHWHMQEMKGKDLSQGKRTRGGEEECSDKSSITRPASLFSVGPLQAVSSRCSTIRQAHSKMVQVAEIVAHMCAGWMWQPRQDRASLQDHARRGWDCADAIVRLIVDVALALALGVWLHRCQDTQPVQGSQSQAVVMQAVDAVSSALSLPAVEPWMSSITGYAPPQDSSLWLTLHTASGRHTVGHRLAGGMGWVFHAWAGISKGLVLPWLVPALACLLYAVTTYGLGLTFLLAASIDALDVFSFHVRVLAATCSTAYAHTGRILLSLWRLFRGKKQNVLRFRVDTLDASVPVLLIGVCLFVPLFLVLPVLASFYALVQGMWIGVLAVRACLWWALTVLNNGAWARVLCRILRPSWLPAASVTLQYQGIVESKGKGEGEGEQVGLQLQVFSMRCRPPSLAALLMAPLQQVWTHVTTVMRLTPKGVLLAALTGGTGAKASSTNKDGNGTGTWAGAGRGGAVDLYGLW